MIITPSTFVPAMSEVPTGWSCKATAMKERANVMDEQAIAHR